MVKSRYAGIRTFHAAMAAAVLAGPALAAPPAGPDIAAWLSGNTDLLASQIAVVGPDNVYSLEPLGPRQPTGELTALVRTEPLAADWGAAHGFQSWEANLLIDCPRARMRVMRSASYPERNRQGRPTPESPSQAWIEPKGDEPAAQLLAAACDPAFAWPLRTTLAATSGPDRATKLPSVQPAVEIKPPPTAATAEIATAEIKPTPAPATAEAKPPPAAPPPPPAPASESQGALKAAAPAPVPTEAKAPAKSGAATYFIQIARGPSEDGARKELEKARKTLGPLADGLTHTTQMAQLGSKRRYTARLEGFPTAAAAEAACKTLADAGQSCFTRPATSAAGRSATGASPKAK